MGWEPASEGVTQVSALVVSAPGKELPGENKAPLPVLEQKHVQPRVCGGEWGSSALPVPVMGVQLALSLQ